MGKKSKKNDQLVANELAQAARLPHSTLGHLQSMDHAVAIAVAMPAHLVRRPSVAVAELLRDARAVAAAAAANLEALVARGLSASLPNELIARADALSQAQAMWLADRHRCLKSDASAVLLHDAEALRLAAIAVVGLALRKSRDGRARLDALTDGEGIADLIADLKELAQLVIDAELALELVNEDPGALAASLEKAGKKVAAALANDTAGRTISSSKDVRDRLAVLVEDAIDEIRAFAAVAFHDDPTHERRGAFASLTPHRRLRH
jgi:hypothetical protein